MAGTESQSAPEPVVGATCANIQQLTRGPVVTAGTGTRSDTATLTAFLHEQVFPEADEVIINDMARPAGGASWETWMIDVSVRRGSEEEFRRLVMKRAPDTGPLAPYLVSKDVVIFETLAASDVPVPHLV